VWQSQRERAADAGRVLNCDIAAQQAGEPAAHGEAETGSALFPRVRLVALRERLEDGLELLGVYPRGIGNSKTFLAASRKVRLVCGGVNDPGEGVDTGGGSGGMVPGDSALGPEARALGPEARRGEAWTGKSERDPRSERRLGLEGAAPPQAPAL
jgi:hypothetical protein